MGSEKYKCMDFLCTQCDVPFYDSSPRLSPGVLSVLQYANAPPRFKQEKALWMESRLNPLLHLAFTLNQNNRKCK